ncbi:unnamed protein product [Brachionus calyciflorus]|uniref:Uncharacterized protein n=1 Tax=Brachionus calyciflorus TaxID=104777 RepID=A0A814PBV7_9BILA|nr:unnamed protein product [Brachionus calyciflorus]
MDLSDFHLRPEILDMSQKRKKSSGIYTIFTYINDLYDSTEQPDTKQKSKSLVDKLNPSIKVSKIKYFIVKFFIFVIHGLILTLTVLVILIYKAYIDNQNKDHIIDLMFLITYEIILSFIVYVLIIFSYSAVNALIFEIYKNDFFSPKYVEFETDASDKLQKGKISFDDSIQEAELQYMDITNSNSPNALSGINAIELSDLTEEKKIHRLLEKDFFMNFFEIFLYIILFVVILTFNYGSTYIDLKVYSNENLKSLLNKKTSWPKVNKFFFIFLILSNQSFNY